MNPITGTLVRRLAGLRAPWLFVIVTTLFVVNLFVPDALPFVDELLLGLLAAGLASWRRDRGTA